MAMEILNHTKKNGLGTLMGKYEHFAHEIQEALIENKKALGKLKKATEEGMVDAHRSVKKNPWVYIGVASACGLLLGFVIGKKK